MNNEDGDSMEVMQQFLQNPGIGTSCMNDLVNMSTIQVECQDSLEKNFSSVYEVCYKMTWKTLILRFILPRDLVQWAKSAPATISFGVAKPNQTLLKLRKDGSWTPQMFYLTLVTSLMPTTGCFKLTRSLSTLDLAAGQSDLVQQKTLLGSMGLAWNWSLGTTIRHLMHCHPTQMPFTMQCYALWLRILKKGPCMGFPLFLTQWSYSMVNWTRNHCKFISYNEGFFQGLFDDVSQDATFE